MSAPTMPAGGAVTAAVDELYRRRFPDEVLKRRDAVWKVLCREWFSRYIPANAAVLEVAAGYCEFINNVAAAERVAVDLNPDTARYAAPEVVVHKAPAEEIADILPHEHFDTAFMSNFLEHCRTREQVLEVLRAVRAVLRPGGRLLILGPNYRYCSREYYDYFDHYLALSDHAVVEALHLAGFGIDHVAPRTLPYTFRQRLPSSPRLVSLYLRLKPAWRLFGQQFFIVASR